MKRICNWKSVVWLTCMTFTSLTARADEIRLSPGPDVQCQEVDADDLVTANPKIINFDPGSQAYVICVSQATLPSLQILAAGLVPRFATDFGLDLDDLQRLKFEQDRQDLFINSAFAEHRVARFVEETLPLSAAPAEVILGPVKSRYVPKQVCRTEYQTKKVCTTEPKEVCNTVYGRLECYTKYVEVCKDVSTPVQICEDKPTLEYYRELSSLSGQWKPKTPAYCAQGQLEKRTRVVYGRTIQEQRCCETKVVYGQTQKTCSPWVAL